MSGSVPWKGLGRNVSRTGLCAVGFSRVVVASRFSPLNGAAPPPLVLVERLHCSISVDRRLAPASLLIRDMVQACLGLSQLGLPAAFILNHLEDRLQVGIRVEAGWLVRPCLALTRPCHSSAQQLLNTSRLLSVYFADQCDPSTPVRAGGVAKALGVDQADIALLVALAGTHTPTIADYQVV